MRTLIGVRHVAGRGAQHARQPGAEPERDDRDQSGDVLVVSIAFVIAACVIWLAPRPTRQVDITQAGH